MSDTPIDPDAIAKEITDPLIESVRKEFEKIDVSKFKSDTPIVPPPLPADLERDIECEACGRDFTPTPKVSVCCECVADLQAKLAEAQQRESDNAESWACLGLDLQSQMAKLLTEVDRRQKAEAKLAQAEAGAADYRGLLESLRWSGLKIEKPTHYSACPVCKMRGSCFGDPEHTDNCEYKRVMSLDAGRATLERLANLERINSRFREWFLSIYRDFRAGPDIRNGCMAAIAEADGRTTAEVQAAWEAKGDRP